MISVYLTALVLFQRLDVEPSPVSLSPHEIESVIGERADRVSAFKFIRESAEKMGIRVFLFGGTAASLGYYVAWDLRHKKGDSRYSSERFDYDFTNLFRSTQDIDLVVDGTAEQAAELEALLIEKQSFLVGGKAHWEVRCLTAHRGNKAPLLKDGDFLKQNTDSVSVGMIELTHPPSGQSRMRDLFHWDAALSPFAAGLASSEIRAYPSSRHFETERAARGMNPSIFFAIRYFIKLTQFGLEMSAEDFSLMKQIIEDFDPGKDLKIPYARDWIIRNAKKICTQSIDLERSDEILEETGLRRKLQLLGDADLEFWINRSALKSFPVGQGKGKTADSLGIDVVSHATRDFRFYESITASPFNKPNVFKSRAGFLGEGAVFGNGFYTLKGREGAWGTGINIRFRVKPGAREGSDFERVPSGILLWNAAAFEVIPESVSLSPFDFLLLLIEQKWDSSDLALAMRFKRRIQARKEQLNLRPTELAWLRNKLRLMIQMEDHGIFRFYEQNNLKPSEIMKSIPEIRPIYDEVYAERAVERDNHAALVEAVASLKHFDFKERLLDNIIAQADPVVLRALLKEYFTQPQSYQFQLQIDKIVDHPQTDGRVLAQFFEAIAIQPAHQENFARFKRAVDRSDPIALESAIRTYLPVLLVLPVETREAWISAILERAKLLNNRELDVILVQKFFSDSRSEKYMNYLDSLVSSGDLVLMRQIVEHVFSKEHGLSRRDLIQKLHQSGDMVIQSQLKELCAPLLRRLMEKKKN